MSLFAFFVLSFSSRDVLDEIWDLIESVSESSPTYSYILYVLTHNFTLTLSYRLLFATGINFKRKYAPLLVLVPLNIT